MRKNMEKRNLNLIFMASNILIGVILGLFIVYSIKKEFNLSVFLGALTSTVIIIVINIIKILLKK